MPHGQSGRRFLVTTVLRNSGVRLHSRRYHSKLVAVLRLMTVTVPFLLMRVVTVPFLLMTVPLRIVEQSSKLESFYCRRYNCRTSRRLSHGLTAE